MTTSLSPAAIAEGLMDKAKAAFGMETFITDTSVSSKCQSDPSGARMKCVVYNGKRSVSIAECPKPALTESHDAIVRVTKTAICGTDLHLYNRSDSSFKMHEVIGHEAMGIVESVGPDVKNVKIGDKVVISCMIACGKCYFCRHTEYSLCTGNEAGLAGGQAEYVHVPVADVNLLVIEPEWNLSDDKVILLSDILCTAWFGTELGNVVKDDVVAIWGAGPVGQLTAQLSVLRGARRVILVDEVKYRLDFAKTSIPQVEIVNFSEVDSETTGANKVSEICRDELGGGPDVCIDCVGKHYAHSLLHQAEMMAGLETDTPESVNSAIQACRKGGRVAIVGAYTGQCNHFNLGMIMQKNLTVRSGQIPVQRYWYALLEKVKRGEIDTSKLITHHMALENASEAYQMFNDKIDGVMKVVLETKGDDQAQNVVSA